MSRTALKFGGDSCRSDNFSILSSLPSPNCLNHHTAEALPAIIPKLRALGYEILTVSESLNYSPTVAAAPSSKYVTQSRWLSSRIS